MKTVEALTQELKLKDDMIEWLANFICETSDYFDCPEGYCAHLGNSDFYEDDEGNNVFPKWCSIQHHKDYYGEWDSSCNCEDYAQCWINFAKDRVSKPCIEALEDSSEADDKPMELTVG